MLNFSRTSHPNQDLPAIDKKAALMHSLQVNSLFFGLTSLAWAFRYWPKLWLGLMSAALGLYYLPRHWTLSSGLNYVSLKVIRNFSILQFAYFGFNYYDKQVLTHATCFYTQFSCLLLVNGWDLMDIGLLSRPQWKKNKMVKISFILLPVTIAIVTAMVTD